jgi:hypothetical protein
MTTDGYLTSLVPSTIVSKSPCVLYVHSFDAIFHDPAQQHSTSSDDSISVMFYDAMRQFMDDLNAEMDRIRSSRSTNMTGVKASCAVVVVVGTQFADKLSPQWKSFVGVRIDLPRMVDRSILFSEVRSTAGPADSGGSNELSAQEENALWEYIEAHELGQVLAQELINQYRLDRIVRENISQLQASVERGALNRGVINYNAYHAKRNSAAVTSALTPSAHVQAIAQRTPSLRGVDCTYGGDGKLCSAGGAGGQKQQSGIAAVRWSDIGGLDR